MVHALHEAYHGQWFTHANHAIERLPFRLPRLRLAGPAASFLADGRGLPHSVGLLVPVVWSCPPHTFVQAEKLW